MKFSNKQNLISFLILPLIIAAFILFIVGFVGYVKCNDERKSLLESPGIRGVSITEGYCSGTGLGNGYIIVGLQFIFK